VREPLLALRGVDARGGVDGGDCAAVAAAVRSGSAKAELIIDRGRLVGGRRVGVPEVDDTDPVSNLKNKSHDHQRYFLNVRFFDASR
jgi:hypothetical protein